MEQNNQNNLNNQNSRSDQNTPNNPNNQGSRNSRNSRNNRNKTKYLTVSAMLTAVGVLFLGLGSVVDTLDLTSAGLASILCVWAVIELRGAYPWMIWAVTAFLSILLLPQKTAGFFYLFIGIYPIAKEKLERLKRLPEMLLKIVIFHIMIALCWLVMKIFVPDQVTASNPWMYLATYALALVAFLLYDYALTKLISFYLVKLQPRIGMRRNKRQ